MFVENKQFSIHCCRGVLIDTFILENSSALSGNKNTCLDEL